MHGNEPHVVCIQAWNSTAWCADVY